MTERTIAIIRKATGAYAALLAAASLLPSGRSWGNWDADFTPNLQNMMHVPCYTVLAVALTLSVVPARRPAVAVLFAGLLAVGFGTVLELAQLFVPGRTAALEDALLNVLGVAIGLLPGWWLRRRVYAYPGEAPSEKTG